MPRAVRLRLVTPMQRGTGQMTGLSIAELGIAVEVRVVTTPAVAAVVGDAVLGAKSRGHGVVGSGHLHGHDASLFGTAEGAE